MALNSIICALMPRNLREGRGFEGRGKKSETVWHGGICAAANKCLTNMEERKWQ
jgi:hypothetical protein